MLAGGKTPSRSHLADAIELLAPCLLKSRKMGIVFSFFFLPTSFGNLTTRTNMQLTEDIFAKGFKPPTTKGYKGIFFGWRGSTIV